MAYRVIDMSKYNIVQSYASLATGVDGAIIRAGYRSYAQGKLTEDPSFKKHMEGCVKNGIPVGIYFFTTAINTNEAREEADYAVKLLKNYKVSFPIFIDTEMSNNNHNGRSDSLSKVVRTNCVIAFCERIKQLGFETGIYASDSWFVSQLEFDKVKDYNLWVASYSKAPVRVSKYIGWQFSSTQKAPGIDNRVDMSYWYVEINKNGVTKPNTTPNANPYKKPTKSVRKGDKGEEVKWLQFELNRYGYNLEVDGDFGNLTLNAVKQFQSKNNLVVDGIVGPKTIAVFTTIVSAENIYGRNYNGGLDLIDDGVSKLFELEPDTIFEIENPISLYRHYLLFIPKHNIAGEFVIVDTATKLGKIKISSLDGTIAGWVKLKDVIAIQESK